MKRISLEELLYTYRYDTYEYREQYRLIKDLIDRGELCPVLTSGTNGKRPALYREYRVIVLKKDYADLLEELKYKMTPLISVDFYLKHPDVYEEDRHWVLLLNNYLKYKRESLEYPVSLNERSFDIWQREKFLSKEQGNKILKRCGISTELLNVYKTTEPLAYYSHTRSVPQKMLILENKDTFYSMRRHLLNGRETILGERIGTLIYGAGKSILKSFQDFDLCVEPYMKHQENEILYFGDLDYEGIGIYEMLAEMFRGRWKICLFQAAYEAMLKKVCAEKHGTLYELPDTKEGQLRREGGYFFSYFDKSQVEQMREILDSGKYIPQEILNISDL